MATPLDGETAAKDKFSAWDPGTEYDNRARWGGGVEAGDMLEAGLDAKQLLRFVSNFRKDPGKHRQ